MPAAGEQTGRPPGRSRDFPAAGRCRWRARRPAHRKEPDIMALEAGLAEFKRAEVSRWRNHYLARVDRDMRNSWPDLEGRLREGAASLSFGELAFGPGKYNDRCVKPAIEHWTQSVVRP